MIIIIMIIKIIVIISLIYNNNDNNNTIIITNKLYPATWKHGWSKHGSSIMPSRHSIPQDLYSPCLNLTISARTMFTPTMCSRRRIELIYLLYCYYYQCDYLLGLLVLYIMCSRYIPLLLHTIYVIMVITSIYICIYIYYYTLYVYIYIYIERERDTYNT